MKRFLTIAAAAAMAAALSAPATAGPPAHRDGFFIGFGLGFGNARWDWADSSEHGASPNERAGTANFRLGGAIREDLVLGAEFQGWAKKWRIETSTGERLGDATVQMGSLTLAATWWPGNVGAYIRGGVGVGRAWLELDDGTITVKPDADTGLALLGALGENPVPVSFIPLPKE